MRESHHRSFRIGFAAIALLGLTACEIGKKPRGFDGPDVPTAAIATVRPTFILPQEVSLTDFLSSSVPEAAPTSQIYHNTKFGFSFKYPGDLSFDKISSTPDFFRFFRRVGFDTTQGVALSGLIEESTLEKAVREENKLNTSANQEMTLMKTSIDGHKTFLLVETHPSEESSIPDNGQRRRITAAFVQEGSHVLKLIPVDTAHTLGTDWFPKILQTLRFGQ